MRTREVVAALSVLSILLAGCASTRNADAGVPPPVSDTELAEVTLTVGDQRGGSQAMLTAAGLLDDVPYSLEWSTFTSGPPLLEAVSAGAVDIGGVGNTRRSSPPQPTRTSRSSARHRATCRAMRCWCPPTHP